MQLLSRAVVNMNTIVHVIRRCSFVRGDGVAHVTIDCYSCVIINDNSTIQQPSPQLLHLQSELGRIHHHNVLVEGVECLQSMYPLEQHSWADGEVLNEQVFIQLLPLAFRPHKLDGNHGGDVIQQLAQVCDALRAVVDKRDDM